jgi:hypothetical protein
MTAKGLWHIHYSVKDRPATQKFDIFHELFEVTIKKLGELDSKFKLLVEPQLSQAADRFASSVLIPPLFFKEKIGMTGCDLVKLSEELGLSHQCLLVALGQNIVDFPFVGAIYEHQPATEAGKIHDIKDYSASLVIKTGQVRVSKELCWLQAAPVRNGHPQFGSLVCAAITGGRPVLWRSSHDENAPVILVRPLLNTAPKPYRIILLAVPNEEYSLIAPQVETIMPIPVNGDDSCPFLKKCFNSDKCLWKSREVSYDR